MIRSRWEINTTVLDDLAVFAGDFTRIASDIGEEVFREIEDELLYELQDYPPPPADSTYERTYKLRDGFEVGFGRDADGFYIFVKNDVAYSKRVVGSFAKSRAAAAALQADVHKGRWVLGKDTLDSWYEDYMARYNRRFMQELSKFGTTSSKRRAFTR